MTPATQRPGLSSGSRVCRSSEAVHGGVLTAMVLLCSDWGFLSSHWWTAGITYLTVSTCEMSGVTGLSLRQPLAHRHRPHCDFRVWVSLSLCPLCQGSFLCVAV